MMRKKKRTLQLLPCLLFAQPLLGATRTFDEVQKELYKKFFNIGIPPKLQKKRPYKHTKGDRKEKQQFEKNYKNVLKWIKKGVISNHLIPSDKTTKLNYKYKFNILHNVAYFDAYNDATKKKLIELFHLGTHHRLPYILYDADKNEIKAKLPAEILKETRKDEILKFVVRYEENGEKLIKLIRKGETHWAEQLLKKCPYLINYQYSHKKSVYTPLVVTCMRANVKVTKMLLRYPDINIYLKPYKPADAAELKNDFDIKDTEKKRFFNDAFQQLRFSLSQRGKNEAEKRTILKLLQQRAIDDFVKEDTKNKGLKYLEKGLQYPPKEKNEKIEDIITSLEVHFHKLLTCAYDNDREELKAALKKAYFARDQGDNPDPEGKMKILKYAASVATFLLIGRIFYKIITRKDRTHAQKIKMIEKIGETPSNMSNEKQSSSSSK
ncbi:MAG: hypothetical protein AAF335_04755 [Bacteroidota bacterium]